MALPLILTWDKSKIDKEEFLRQLYVLDDSEDNYIGMAQSIGTFVESSKYINIFRGDERGGYRFTNNWTTIKGTPDVYKPLSRREVS